MVNSFRARWGSIAKRSLLALIVALAFGLASCSAPGGAIVDPTDTVRTAIAIGQTQTYRTDLPGDGCDIHGGLWSSGLNTSTSCTPQGTIVKEGKGESIGVLFFDWMNGYTFPSNSSIAVSIASLPNDGCAGITTRTQPKGPGAYGFYICSDGEQSIVRYNATSGKSTTIAGADQPRAPAGSSFQMTVTSIGDQQCLEVAGQQKFCATDTTYKTTDAVGLGVFTESGNGSASFSDFVFTPLP
jgi:hypothetical protein